MSERKMRRMDPILISASDQTGKLVLKTVDVTAPPPAFPGEPPKPRTLPPDLREVYQYIPKSGCYAPVQTATITVLREGCSEESAKELMETMGLYELSEEKHCLVLLPNPTADGWNYHADDNKKNDLLFLNRMQFLLAAGRDVGTHSSMSYYFGIGIGAAMAVTFAAHNPSAVTSLYLREVPEKYVVPAGAVYSPVPAVITGDAQGAEEYLAAADLLTEEHKTESGKYSVRENRENCVIKLYMGPDEPLSKTLIYDVWDKICENVRRWPNDTKHHGRHETRVDFVKEGFIEHQDDKSLELDGQYVYTWYECVPDSVIEKQKAGEPVPLVLCYHGGGCVPLYYAEQNRWHELGAKYGFATVYPESPVQGHWNIGFDPNMPDDAQFSLRIIDKMKEKYLIDETRIYVAGFSNGAMMANSMAAAYPDVFAAAAPSNALFEHYFDDTRLLPYCHRQDFTLKEVITKKKTAFDYIMPVVQTVGMADRIGGPWPNTSDNDLSVRTINYWKTYNHIEVTPVPDPPASMVGLAADETEILGMDGRFTVHKWYGREHSVPLYEMITVENLPHAVDLRTPYIAWEFMRMFRRLADGTLMVQK